MSYKVTVNRLDGSQVSANAQIEGRTPKPGEIIHVQCDHSVVKARVQLVDARSDVDWVIAREVG
ncbi:MAG TPA: hypothetical protein VEJ16_15675 [Alphaproteobacteria bacterium]|nr:hypothetical protein [Alphaproteobacteria bacterium]